VSDVPGAVWLRGLVALSLVMGGAAVASGSARSEPPGPAPSRETGPLARDRPLSFDAGALAQLNGVAPHADATAVCGSNTETFLTELFHTAPTAVKVNNEWGDIAGAKQVAVEGPVRTTHLGPTDLPLTHI
jgi:hypothetical protein